MVTGDRQEQGNMGVGGQGKVAASHPHLAQPRLFSYQHFHQQRQPRLEKQLQYFWANRHREISNISDIKNHNLPVSKIKKIMKADEDIKMIAAEAPVLFAKACEMFILELTHRSWARTEDNKRQTLQKNDVLEAISRTELFDFLVDILPTGYLKNDVPVPSMSGNGPYGVLPYNFGGMKFMYGQQAQSLVIQQLREREIKHKSQQVQQPVEVIDLNYGCGNDQEPKFGNIQESEFGMYWKPEFGIHQKPEFEFNQKPEFGIYQNPKF